MRRERRRLAFGSARAGSQRYGDFSLMWIASGFPPIHSEAAGLWAILSGSTVIAEINRAGTRLRRDLGECTRPRGCEPFRLHLPAQKLFGRPGSRKLAESSPSIGG